MPSFTHLDEPVAGLVTNPVSAVRGWIAGSGSGRITPLQLVNDRRESVPVARVDRPDVQEAKPSLSSAGFAGWIDARLARAGPWRLQYEQSGQVGEATLDLRVGDGVADAFAHAKTRKLARIRGLLRCPLCRTELAGDGALLRCATGHEFGARADGYDLINDALRADAAADPTDNVSAHGYDDRLSALIAASPGPVLDVGAGLRPTYRDDVINLEIVPYPTTDVVAASEHLPFADDTFDLVISVAVLEHVRDPFRAAGELQRVLRPGGTIFAAVPFLQPYHGYPHHYYNMTAAGLRNIFPLIDAHTVDVPAGGHPIFALSWIAKAWRDALAPAAAAEFERLTVAELAAAAESFFDRSFVLELPEKTRAELAALNVLIGRKRA